MLWIVLKYVDSVWLEAPRLRTHWLLLYSVTVCDSVADFLSASQLAFTRLFLTVILVRKSSVYLVLCFRLLSSWKVNSSPSVWWKVDWFCLCLAPFCFFFILKNSPVLNDDKHTHNMMQPYLCLKIWRVVLCYVLYWIFPKPNTLYSGQKGNFFATFFCNISLVPCCKQDACTGFLLFTPLLWSNYRDVDPSSVFSYYSH